MSSGYPDKAKLRPLTLAAKEILRRLGHGPIPCQEVNFGIRERLLRGGLVENVDLPSPYPTRKGSVAHLRLLPVGDEVSS